MAENLADTVARILDHQVDPDSWGRVQRHGHEFESALIAGTRVPVYTKRSLWSDGVDELKKVPADVRTALRQNRIERRSRNRVT